MDKIFLEYSLPHKIEFKWHGRIFFHVDMDEIKMDEIHHKKTLFNKNFQMNLFLANNYPENHSLFIL
jgi:hypothetical protein